ncbi:MAG: hypothetical protein SGJ18_07275 [Pseudomonadota bacterium]|nr:hypothetical protein [Pseudomonadota bacterium]
MKILLIVLMSQVWLAADAQATLTGYVPSSWYVLDQGPSLIEDGDLVKFESTLQKIFKSQSDALEGSNSGLSEKISAEKKPKDWVPWRLHSYITELALSASGTIGVLGIGGTAYSQIYWQKKEATENVNTDENQPIESFSGLTFAFDGSMGPEKWDFEIARITNAVLSLGRIEDEKNFSKNLKTEILKFKERANAVSFHNESSSFWVSRYRLDLNIGASGNVSFGTAGGDVNLRLEWYRAKQKTPGFVSRELTAESEKIRDFILTLASDLSTSLDDQTILPGNFVVNEFRVGLGIGLKGDAGIAKIEGKMIGHIYFSRKISKKSFVNSDLYLTKTTPASRNIKIIEDSNGFMGVSDTFEVDREIFKDGLKKALKISSFLTRISGSSQSDKWAISKAKVGFDMSLKGDIAIAAITGTVATEFVLTNLNF